LHADPGSFEGRVALVTGAARGQGRSHALALAAAGADLVLCDVAAQLQTVPYPLAQETDLEETAAAVRATGRRCLPVVVDVRDVGEMERAASRAAAELGTVDILCSNAGVISFGSSWQLSEQQWNEVVDTNLKGSWSACRAVIPGMLERGRGAIVLTASAAAFHAYGGMAHYVASKHGVVGLMRTLALELAPHGIRVNAVVPGGVRTVMGTNDAMQGQLALDPEASRALTALLDTDVVEPEDVTAAVVWLASDAARYVTGVALPVDAGVLLR
jgi:SDR family mycofactocin-dependent oxidoreductase